MAAQALIYFLRDLFLPRSIFGMDLPSFGQRWAGLEESRHSLWTTKKTGGLDDHQARAVSGRPKTASRVWTTKKRRAMSGRPRTREPCLDDQKTQAVSGRQKKGEPCLDDQNNASGVWTTKTTIPPFGRFVLIIRRRRSFRLDETAASAQICSFRPNYTPEAFVSSRRNDQI